MILGDFDIAHTARDQDDLLHIASEDLRHEGIVEVDLAQNISIDNLVELSCELFVVSCSPVNPLVTHHGQRAHGTHTGSQYRRKHHTATPVLHWR